MTIKELFKNVEVANMVAKASYSHIKYVVEFTYKGNYMGDFSNYDNFKKYINDNFVDIVVKWLKKVTFEYNEYKDVISLSGVEYDAFGEAWDFECDLELSWRKE